MSEVDTDMNLEGEFQSGDPDKALRPLERLVRPL